MKEMNQMQHVDDVRVKKEYNAPSMLVIELNTRNHILENSPIGGGGGPWE